MKVKFGILVFVSCLVLAFQSCSLNNGSSANTPSSYFLIANFSPNSVPIDFYANGSNIYTGVGFSNNFGYYQVASGSYNFVLAATGTTQQLANVSYSFSQNTNYSIFAIDTVVNASVQTVLVQDNLTNPVGDSARIRFLDFSPNAGTVDLVPINGGPAVDSGRYFDDQAAVPAYANFVSVRAPIGADTTYSFNVRQSGTQTMLINGASISITAGKNYTVVLGGLLNPTPSEQPLSINLVNNP